MDTAVKVALIVGSTALISAVVTSILAPHFNWGIAKKKEALEYKRQLINQWRELVGRLMTTYYAELADEEDMYRPFRYIVQDRGFPSLKRYLSEDDIREIENERDYHTLAEMLLREIARIELAWDLFPVVDQSPNPNKTPH